MKLDACAWEGHFIDHLAPVWLALHPSQRGTFYVDPSLMDRAARLGVPASPQPRPPHTVANPKPNTDGRPCLVAAYGDVKEGRRLGYGPFAFLEHGAGQNYGTGRRANASYAGGLDREDNELILAPNAYSANLWRAAYPNARVEVVGCPKLDFLPRRESGPGPVICVSFHWPASPSISGYAGTAIGEYQHAIRELAKHYTVIGHCHPKGDWPKRMERIYRKLDIPFVPEFTDVCRQADLYICDNSSTIFEFAATSRPVVLLNSRYWSRKVNLGLRFWDAAHVGINVDRPEDLPAAVERALLDEPAQQIAREDALRYVYGLRTNGAAAAATAITDWLALAAAA